MDDSPVVRPLLVALHGPQKKAPPLLAALHGPQKKKKATYDLLRVESAEQVYRRLVDCM